MNDIKLPDGLLTNKKKYLDPLNFVTNFVLLRNCSKYNSRFTTINYWKSYGANNVKAWFCLFSKDGEVITDWYEKFDQKQDILSIDTKYIVEKNNLDPNQDYGLFVHIINCAGHDLLKYAFDIYSDDFSVLTATHDANPFPADLYAGIPAARPGEKVILNLQNQ